jgi:ribosomal protein L25, Ctc-form
LTRLAINVQRRTDSGKGAARRLRREGKVPAVVYGRKTGNVYLAVDASALNRLLAGGGATALVDLIIDGNQTQTALIREVQRQPDRDDVLHVDFHAVEMDQEVEVQVPVVLVGEDQRESDGGIVTQLLRELAVTCLPADIPERIEADVSGLRVGDSLLVSDLVVPPGVTVNTPAEEVVVSVVASKAVAAEAEEAEAAGEEAESGEKPAGDGE